MNAVLVSMAASGLALGPPEPLLLVSSAQQTPLMEPKSTSGFARIAAKIPWTNQCLTSQCLLGSLAADALCEWADTLPPKHSVCLLPSRFLGGGLHEGLLDFEDLAEVLPPHPLVSLTLPAGTLRRILSDAQGVAMQSCAAPYAAHSWQVSSNVRLAWSCTGNDAAELRWRSATNRSSFEPLDDDVPIHVLTLAPALPLLLLEETGGDRVAEAHHFAVSAQHALADYLRSHSPLNASSAIEAVAPSASRISMQPPPMSAVPSSACVPSSCAARTLAITRAAAALGVSAYDAAHVHAVAASSAAAIAFIGALLLITTLVALCVWMRPRRWLSLDALPAGPLTPATGGKGTGGAAAAAVAGTDGLVPPPVPQLVPPVGLTTSPVSSPLLSRRGNLALLRDPEREPLRTGGLRVVSYADLGV